MGHHDIDSFDPTTILGGSIDDGRLKLVKLLGSGSGGVVYLAEEDGVPSPCQYAVKCLVRAQPGSPKELCQARELANHKIMSSHPNVVTLHRVVEEAFFIFLVMEYCPGGDLHNFLRDGGIFAGDTSRIKNVFLQLVDALAACHNAGVYHRDLKPENILCNADCTKVFLSDFGLSTTNPYSTTWGIGSWSYMSPECIHYDVAAEAYSSRRNDIWALGPILHSLMTGRNPWRVAATTDPTFKVYLRDPHVLRKMFPISEGANMALRHIFTRKEKNRVSLNYLRGLVLDLDTFFMSPDDVAQASPQVKYIAEQYFRRSRHQLIYHETNTSYGAVLESSDERRMFSPKRKDAEDVGHLSEVELGSPQLPQEPEIQEVKRSQPTNPPMSRSIGVTALNALCPDLPALPPKAHAPRRPRKLSPKLSAGTAYSTAHVGLGLVGRGIEHIWE